MAGPFDDLWRWSNTCDVEFTCPSCLKKMAFESRFIIPLLPKAITCPYCDTVNTVHKKEDSGKER
jgi:hypothetical protein